MAEPAGHLDARVVLMVRDGGFMMHKAVGWKGLIFGWRSDSIYPFFAWIPEVAHDE